MIFYSKSSIVKVNLMRMQALIVVTFSHHYEHICTPCSGEIWRKIEKHRPQHFRPNLGPLPTSCTQS